MAKNAVTFVKIADFKALHGVNKLNLCFNPEKNTFSLRLDNSRDYIKIDRTLVLSSNGTHRIDTSVDMSILCDDDSQGSNLDACCLVKVSPSQLTDTGSSI